jgi:hypothetical protein
VVAGQYQNNRRIALKEEGPLPKKPQRKHLDILQFEVVRLKAR